MKSDEAGIDSAESAVNQKFDALGLTTCGSGSGGAPPSAVARLDAGLSIRRADVRIVEAAPSVAPL
jgi:hypothetical protein